VILAERAATTGSARSSAPARRFDRELWRSWPGGLIGVALPGGVRRRGLGFLGSRSCSKRPAAHRARPAVQTALLGAPPIAGSEAPIRSGRSCRGCAGELLPTAALHEEGGDPDPAAGHPDGLGLTLHGAKLCVPPAVAGGSSCRLP
jgi:hypothetical protein